MADGTSVGKIFLDVEVTQKSFNNELNKLSKGFNSSFKNMFSGITNQTNNFIKESFSKMNNSFKKAAETGANSNEKVSKSIGKMNTQYDKTQEKIKQIQKELATLDMQRDSIMQKYADFPSLMGMSREDSLEQMLSKDPQFTKLGTKAEELEMKMTPLREESERLSQAMQDVGVSTDKASSSTSRLSSFFKKATKNLFGFSMMKNIFTKETKKATKASGGFGNTIGKVTKMLARRLIVYQLLARGIQAMFAGLWKALKVNDQFSRSLNQIKTNLLVAFQPIYDFILPALNTLMQAISRVTQYIATAISSLFGKTYKQSYDAAKGINSAVKEMDGLGASAKKTKGQLAGFDELNVLGTQDASGGAGDFEMTMPDTSMDLTGFESFMERIKTMFEPAINSLKDLGNALDPLKNFASDSLKDFYNNFLVPVGKWVLGEGLPRFIDAITKGLSEINWQPIKDGLKKVWDALAPFSTNVGEGLLWFWEKVLVPLGTWTTNEIVPRFLDLLAGGIDFLNRVIETLKPLAQWLWDKFLLPLAEWTGGAALSILDGIAFAFESILNYISGIQDVIADSDSFLDALFNVGGYLVKGLLNGILAAIEGIGTWLWDNLVGPIINSVKNLFGIESPSTVFIEIGKMLIEGLKVGIVESLSLVINFLVTSLDNIKSLFTNTWDSITNKTKEIWNRIKTFLIDEMWNSLKNNAQTIWNSIKGNILNPIDVAWTELRKIWNNVKSFVLRKWDEIRIGISGTANNLVEAIKSPFDIAKNWIGGIIGDAYYWGRNLISNIVDGIKSMVGNVKDAVGNVADTIKDFLGFSSPSKKGPGATADRWMPNLMGMLADGIQDNIYEVSAAVNVTAGAIRQGVQPNTNDIASSIGNMISQSIQGISDGNINLTVKIGEDTIMNKVISGINRQSRISGETVIKV